MAVKKRWQSAVFQLRKSSVITKLELDDEDENLYDGKLLCVILCMTCVILCVTCVIL